MRERVGDAVRDVLDQRAAERHREQLLAAADAEHRHAARQRAACQRELRRGAPLLQRHRRVPPGLAVERRIHVEGAARHHQRVEPVEPVLREAGLVRQRDRQAARRDDRRRRNSAAAHTRGISNSRRAAPHRA